VDGLLVLYIILQIHFTLKGSDFFSIFKIAFYNILQCRLEQTMPYRAYNHHQHYQPPAMWSNHVLDQNQTEPGQRPLLFGPLDSEQTSINVTPQALHLKIDDNNLLHLPEGVWHRPAPIASSVQLSPVGNCLGQTTKLALS